MFFIALQIFFASSFGLLIKWAQNRKREDVITVGAINYIVAAIAILPEWFGRTDLSATSAEIQGAAWAGGAMGGIYFIAFFFVIYVILWAGAAAATVVSVLSILMPIAFAAFWWGDKPGVLQVAGIVLALVSLLLIGLPARRKSDTEDVVGITENEPASESRSTLPWLVPMVLLGFFLLCGMSRIAQEAFKHVSIPAERPTFLLSAFVVAGVPSVVFLFVRHVVQRKRMLATELVFGIAMGLANILQTHFILKCLEYYEGYIVFPVVSAGAIILTTLVATRFLGEKLSRNAYIGICIAVVALVLLNWIPE